VDRLREQLLARAGLPGDQDGRGAARDHPRRALERGAQPSALADHAAEVVARALLTRERARSVVALTVRGALLQPRAQHAHVDRQREVVTRAGPHRRDRDAPVLIGAHGRDQA
jgi:hypothetical protein